MLYIYKVKKTILDKVASMPRFRFMNSPRTCFFSDLFHFSICLYAFLRRCSCLTFLFSWRLYIAFLLSFLFLPAFDFLGEAKPGREAWTTARILLPSATFHNHLEEKQSLPKLSSDVLHQWSLEH